MPSRLAISRDRVAEFCKKWKVTEFALFGSVVRDDFGPQSDVDVLLTFSPDAHHDLFHFVEMKRELEAVFGRRVDLVEKAALRNPFRRHAILKGHEVLYAA